MKKGIEKTTGVNNYRYRPIETRLIDGMKISESGCWEWQGAARTSNKKMPYGGIKIFQKTHLVHRVSYEHFIGDIPAGMQILHKCDNPKCINPSHLALGTNTENYLDKLSKGRQAKGEASGRAVLKNIDIPTIKELAKNMSRRCIAKIYNVQHNTINNIVNNKTWNHI